MAQEFNIGRMKAEAIAKAFGVDIEKGRVGVYEDNAENRRLNRVGQQYGHKAEEKPSTGRQPARKEEQGQGKPSAQQAGGQDIGAAAKSASDEALKRAAADSKAAPEIKAAAEKELKERGVKTEEEGSKRGGNSAVKELSAILDPLDSWGDDDWNDADKNAELFSQIRSVIEKYDVSEEEFKQIAKKYQGLDLVYSDYAPHDKILPIAKEKIRTELKKFDSFSDDDWNDPGKQEDITNKLTFYIRHYNVSEEEWNDIVKPYAEGLSGLPYSDFK